MKVLDLFSGLKGWSDPFKEAGHDVFTIDNNPALNPDMALDIGDVKAVLAAVPWKPDLILASPPCTSFSIAGVSHHWTKDGQPKSAVAVEGVRLVRATVDLIHLLGPRWWIVENPVGRLRTLYLLPLDWERRTVTYCKFGERRQKRTDLWGEFPEDLNLPWACAPRMTCHEASPRGAVGKGTQGMETAISAKIPRRLAEMVMRSLPA